MNMLNKEACEKALENLRSLERKDNFKKWGEQVAPQVNCDAIDQLIKEHFKSKENTLEFKNFKLHADTTLKCMAKDELISYIHMLHHNWSVSDEQLFNVIKKIKTLQDELDAIKNPQLYKFEDLKVGMWVWDDKLNACFLIKELKPQSYWNVIIYANYLTDTFEEMHFEKNRFYPVTKVLCNGIKKNEREENNNEKDI